MDIFIKRVATHDNVADLPSRTDDDREQLRRVGVKEIDPVWKVSYTWEETWEALCERWALVGQIHSCA